MHLKNFIKYDNSSLSIPNHSSQIALSVKIFTNEMVVTLLKILTTSVVYRMWVMTNAVKTVIMATTVK